MLENIGYLEALYTRYQDDPQSVSAEWQDYFGAAPGEMVTEMAAETEPFTKAAQLLTGMASRPQRLRCFWRGATHVTPISIKNFTC